MFNLSSNIEVSLDNIYKDLRKFEGNNSLNLFNGNAGLALFYFYYAQYRSSQNAYNHALSLTSSIVNNIDKLNDKYFFSNGLAGIGWFLSHIANQSFVELDNDEFFDELDNLLFPIMISSLENDNYDFVHGAIGIALYYTSRKQNKKINKYLEGFVEILYNKKEIEGQSIKWQSLINSSKFNKGYNISLSHGISSIVMILSKLLSMNINSVNDRVLFMLKGSTNYILSQRFQNEDFVSIFPTLSLQSPNKRSSRLAWCYGDLGIGFSLLKASIAMKDHSLEKESLEILNKTTFRKNLKTNRVHDAILCHGTSGIAHINRKIYNTVNDNHFLETANYWQKRTLMMARFKNGIGNYKVWRSRKYGGWMIDNSFLYGVTGIGLSLISYLSEDDLTWDESLLLS